MTTAPEVLIASSPAEDSVPQPMEVDEPASSRGDNQPDRPESHPESHPAQAEEAIVQPIEEYPQEVSELNPDEQTPKVQEMEHNQPHPLEHNDQHQEYPKEEGYSQAYGHGRDQGYEQGHAQSHGQGRDQDYEPSGHSGNPEAYSREGQGEQYAEGHKRGYAQGHELQYPSEDGQHQLRHHQGYTHQQGQEYAQGGQEGDGQGYDQKVHYDQVQPLQEDWQSPHDHDHGVKDHSLRPHSRIHETSGFSDQIEPIRRLSFQHHADLAVGASSSSDDRPSAKRSSSSDGGPVPAPGRRLSAGRENVDGEDDIQESTTGSGSKGVRAKREPVKKVPKVYPPRKPRVKPAPAEATMTLRTDSALSTLASAAVAIKNHQGDLSTLSVPPLSPSVEAQQSSPSSSQEPTASSPQPSSVDQTGVSATEDPTRIGSVRPPKANILQDSAGYRCELCPGERFGRVHDLKRHQISKHNEMTWPCDFCHRPFVRRDALLRHYSVKANRKDGVHPTTEDMNRLQEAKARAKLVS
ncbi:hypothetical protein BGZ83_006029 [Gryganskiella cystojenkinii]|nr:hypothetical protein BGZ83_006029 [Gryganskiella cystojenkinii]